MDKIDGVSGDNACVVPLGEPSPFVTEALRPYNSITPSK